MGRGLVGRGVVVGFSGVPLAHQGSGVEALDIGGAAAIGQKRTLNSGGKPTGGRARLE